MRFVIYGAGGVGSLYGGLLAKCGKEVVFIGRGEHLKAMKEKGLTVKSFKYGTFTVKESDKVKFVSSPEEAGKADVVLVCVKSYDTEKVAPHIPQMLKENSVVVSVQNGIENEEILAKFVGKERVLGATAFVGTYVERPGVVVHEAAGLLEIGELSGKPSERVERLVEELRSCGIEARASKDINYTLWKKLVWNVAFNPYSVITGATVGELLENPLTFEVLKKLMEECYKVAESYGVRLKPKIMENYLKSSPDLKNYKTSMLLDFEKGKPIEIEGITGALIRKAQAKGVEVPFNRCVYATVKFLDEKRRK
ncbi:ketopantoate reductase family protein [Thermovibrio ammonificans]|uniref:2-dehydropantoate 2-reductase n=1 Tax=Thermovibrio ammonificans (strain DSM 15698 / JCM 12110 / HB-1) TaxID=648996 RepID=E8T5M7_THEA1|nr:ketopantoate reductase family protein [Thermovibrio ammonificans]ADU96502.1 2-dehydropantoate 2-reductase [Thermovibrio ammonificans HB-1]